MELRERAAQWMARDPSPSMREAMQRLVDGGDEGALARALTGRLAFGTAGLRGVVGPGPQAMNELVVRESSLGLADYLLTTVPDAAKRGVVVAHDARHLSPELAREAVAAFACRGLRVYFHDAPTATPMAARSVTRTGAAAGVMITASHNPPEYNGYKVYWGNGAQIIEPHDSGIADAIDAVAAAPLPEIDVPSWVASDAVTRLTEADERTWLDEIAAACTYAPRSARASLRVAYSAMHGVGAHLIEPLVASLGYAPLHVVASQHAPDGSFPTVRFPNPEEPGALDALHARATEAGAHVAIAHDPDADRLAVCIPADGGWRTLTGDETGALLGDFLLESSAGGPRAVGTTIVSSRLLAAIAAHHGAVFFQTLTGFKWIANRAMQGSERFVFGYEEAIGFTVGELVRDKDGLGAAAALLDLCAVEHARGRTLQDRLDTIYARHGVYRTHQRSQALAPGQPGSDLTDALRAARPERIAGIAVRAWADLRSGDRGGDWGATSWELPSSDVLVFLLADETRVIARPSGTEPKVKFYYEVIEPATEGDVAAARRRGDERLAALVDAHRAELAALLPPAPAHG